ncbi:hypothetical protein M432DRAFT_619839 [Thermoascus aurantiacus ATCC 26904]
MDTLQFRDFIHKKAQRGEALSEDEIGTLATETADLAGNEPVRGHSVAKESINVEEAKWASKAYEVLGKPVNEITKGEARDLQAKETRAFAKLPAKGSLASHVQSIADQNEDLRFRENA